MLVGAAVVGLRVGAAVVGAAVGTSVGAAVVGAVVGAASPVLLYSVNVPFFLWHPTS